MGGTDVLDLVGCGMSLLVGTVSATVCRAPARRGRSSVVVTEPLRLRVVMSGDDPDAVANLAGIASLTGADVHTLRSVQLKGEVVLVEPATVRGSRPRDRPRGGLLPGHRGGRRVLAGADAPAPAARGDRLRDGRPTTASTSRRVRTPGALLST